MDSHAQVVELVEIVLLMMRITSVRSLRGYSVQRLNSDTWNVDGEYMTLTEASWKIASYNTVER
jgi:hypothetical protein